MGNMIRVNNTRGWTPPSPAHRHRLTVGRSGSGKTTLSMASIPALLDAGRPVVVLDTQGEYKTAAAVLGGVFYRLEPRPDGATDPLSVPSPDNSSAAGRVEVIDLSEVLGSLTYLADESRAIDKPADLADECGRFVGMGGGATAGATLSLDTPLTVIDLHAVGHGGPMSMAVCQALLVRWIARAAPRVADTTIIVSDAHRVLSHADAHDLLWPILQDTSSHGPALHLTMQEPILARADSADGTRAGWTTTGIGHVDFCTLASTMAAATTGAFGFEPDMAQLLPRLELGELIVGERGPDDTFAWRRADLRLTKRERALLSHLPEAERRGDPRARLRSAQPGNDMASY